MFRDGERIISPENNINKNDQIHIIEVKRAILASNTLPRSAVQGRKLTRRKVAAACPKKRISRFLFGLQ
jgi:hypothetical protein